MLFKDRTNERRIKRKLALLPIKCDCGNYAWLERVLIYQTCTHWRTPFGNCWETNAVLPARFEDEIKNGDYQHPVYLHELSVWDEPQTEVQ